MNARLSQCVVIFTKAPELGHVKTRLQPLLGAQGALQLYLTLLQTTVAKHAQAPEYDVQLAVAGDIEHPQITRLAQTYAMPVFPQHGVDLGEKMHQAAVRLLQHYEKVVIVGCDCPALGVDVVAQAFAALETHPVTLAPAQDGGYVLIGLRQAERALFAQIDWGTDQVLRQTQAQVKELGWRMHYLPTLWDLDRPEDYARYVALHG